MSYGAERLEVDSRTKERLRRCHDGLLALGGAQINKLLEVHGASPIELNERHSHPYLSHDDVVHVALALLEHHLRGLP